LRAAVYNAVSSLNQIFLEHDDVEVNLSKFVGFAVLISARHRALAFVPPRASGSMKGEQSAMIASCLDGKHRTATSSPVQRLAFDLRNSEFSDPIPRKTMAGCTRPATSIKC